MMKDEELIDKTDEAIAELVYNKTELLKAYNYYDGERDAELFRYLEENFGIGSPTSVEFTPLLKKHVDALVGEYLGTPILPKISCKDKNTISSITREKELTITQSIVKFLKEHLSNSLLSFILGLDITDKQVKQQLDKIILDIDQSFVSQYEIAALDIIEYLMQSRETDMITKLRQLLTDLLITGYTYFRVKASPSKTNVQIEVLDPRNTFIDRNPDSVYAKDSYRAVVRYWMSKSEILTKYGKELNKEDIKSLKDEWQSDSASAVYRRTFGDTCTAVMDDIKDEETIVGYPDDEYGTRRFRLLPVYEVEWVEADDNFVMLRYTTVRVGDDIYILRGLDKNVIRSKDNPNFCGLTVNGVYFLNRNRKPYSLILKCAHLLDRYDLLIYYRDRLIANSGTSGTIMDMSLLPANLGVKWPERLEKWLAYKKAGILLIDTSMEGRNENGNAPINTIFNGFDDTLKALAVLAIEIAIQSVEQTTSSITGVFRERLNGIELRDAVTNIKLGVLNSYTVTKHYYQLMDLVVCEILLGSLNEAKIVFKKGLTGTIILGDRQLRIFTALPEHFTLTDYDIHVVSSTEVMLDLLTIKQLVPELLKSLMLDADVILEALTSKSLTDLKYKVLKAMKVQKEENNQLMQLQQLLEQANQLLQQMLQQLQLAESKVLQLDEKRLNLEQTKINLEYQVNWLKAQTDLNFKNRQMDVEEKRTEIEIALLRDGNPYNDKIKQA